MMHKSTAMRLARECRDKRFIPWKHSLVTGVSEDISNCSFCEYLKARYQPDYVCGACILHDWSLTCCWEWNHTCCQEWESITNARSVREKIYAIDAMIALLEVIAQTGRRPK